MGRSGTDAVAMPFEVMLDGPDEYRSLPGPSYEGANPNLLLRIEELLLEHEDRIVALDAAMFLFSAPRLARALLAQGRAGTRVRVYTTPLDSYHRSPVVLHDRPGQRMSKRDIAGRILTYFAEQGQESGVELRIFSHVFLRSARYRRFERGSLPYSLHTKTLRILLDDGEEIVVLSTSNLTAADETKDELLVITGPGPADPAVEQFFDLLEASSHPLTVEADILDYPIRSVAEGIVSPIHRFTGPFLDRSNDRAADVLRAHVEGARERLVVAAEHIAAGDFTIEGSQCADARSGRVRRRGVLSPLLDGDVRPDRVTLLSQTSGRRQAGRRPGNTAAFTAFEDAFAATGAGRHYAADSNHLKFIVADDVVLIGSSNLTPTSFAYLPNVELVLPADLQRTAPGRRFRCIHSEVGHWIRLHDRALADTLEEHVAQIAARPGTVRLA